MPVMSLAGMLAHEIDLLEKGFQIQVLETGQYKRAEGRYFCRITKGSGTTLKTICEYGDDLRAVKRKAMLKAYE